MATVPVLSVDAAGCHVPAYADCLTYFQSVYQGIYGADTYLGPDSQDGQFVAIVALALSDANAMGAAIYNSFSPSTAQGAGLSSIVKQNGIARKVATYSSSDIVVVGQAGAIISNGLVSDGTYQWALPVSVVIPAAGQVTVTATCTTIGAIMAPSGTITKIVNPTRGWQSVSNPTAATPGAPIENDAQLRIRQALSTELPSQGILAGIVGNVLALPGVDAVTPYENANDAPDANGLPGHSICLVVDGGDDTQIATTIASGRPCCGTFGSTQVLITDEYGLAQTYSFQRRSAVPITYRVGIKALAGFTAAIKGQIADALVAWTNALGTGQDILLGRTYVPLNLNGATSSFTYEVLYVYAARDGYAPADADVDIKFSEYAQTAATSIQFVLTS